MSSSSNLLLYLSARADQILNTLIEEAALASCISASVGCSGRDDEERGVEREELDVGVDANRRLFVGASPSLKLRTGEGAKDWEREESEGWTKGFANLGGGFEDEALAFITIPAGLKSRLAADHMNTHQQNAPSRRR